ncbi:related to SKI3 - protein involved in exosome mediated 3` to 5` mRNA degradation [Pseudozyma flocculosa]|uniref:Related to SKI3 - protein involved in exosome mediated 3` to 5` mRNA degradation n=1 Tax=Pseudozyma flocculosa TaxID=84751 RepID=A0A5C3F7M1_9BASI|nr:related to SKI3 - protein involved in exosome mediated 3` to 5` mRNA degradation [Pseudozyma flocculosa]
MSTAYTKQKLKQSRDAIAQKDWQAALQAANHVLEHEPNNYNANVFLGLASLNLEQYTQSETAYNRATSDHPDQPLAWQGLERFYNHTRKWDQLRHVLVKLIQLHDRANDPTRCAEAWQRLVRLEREEGGRKSLADALQLVLPDSQYYPTLSSLDPPDQTQPESTTTFDTQMAVHVNSLDILVEIVHLIEKLEADTVEKETEKRRMRIEGARLGKEALRNQVIVDVCADSKLPSLYEQVLSHPNAPDDLRRETESKLLRRHLQLLRAYPSSAATRLAGPSGTAAVNAEKVAEQQQRDLELREKKHALRDAVVRMAEGIVIIGLDDELAWEIVLEWSDTGSLVDLPLERLRKFITLFPRSGRSKSFQVLLLLLQDEQFLVERDELEKRHDVEVDRSRDADLLGLAIEGLEDSPSSLLASRIAAVLYLLDRDHASASEVATGALGLARRIESDAGVTLTGAKFGISSVLLTALTHLHPPQNHAKAIRLADSILANEPSDLDALLARAYIDQAASRWQEARAHLETVRQLASGLDSSTRTQNERRLSISRDPGLEAWIETAWCDVHLGRLEEAKVEMEQILEQVDPVAFEGVGSEERAKIWWRLGRCHWDMGGEHRTDPANAFTCFITALKRNPAFAPAYTSLGLYYETIASPPDAVRASKCFQKAFELDARENEAARRLAEGFADEREWDLVEVVARRTIEGEGGGEALDAGSGSASSSASIAASRRHLSQNSWAWQAIGSVEVSRKAYDKAILAFQIALRSQPEASPIWQRLGEAYAAAGRHVAALKCFDKCLELIDEQNRRAQGGDAPVDDGWQARYCIGDVQRQLGNFELAIDIFAAILRDHAAELGVRIALADTLLMSARSEYHAGYVERSEVSARRAIREAGRVLLGEDQHLRSAWKVVADAVFHLSRFGRVDDVQLLLLDGDGDGDGESGRLEALLDLATKMETDAKLPSIQAVTRQTVDDGLASLLSEAARDDTGAASAAGSSVSHSDVFLGVSVYLYKLRVVINAADSIAAGSAWCDLSVSLYRLARSLADVDAARAANLTRQAIGSIKEALRCEPGNESFWLVLGNLTFAKSLKVSQHAYIRAIESAPRSAIPWTDLGFLYMHHGDVALANEAFIKAQTADPDAAEAWVGQALVAQHHGDARATRVLFDHAVKLSQGAVLEADYGFGQSVFSSSPSSRSGDTELHAPSRALSTFLSHNPTSTDALHLSALFCERLGQMDIAIDRIRRAAALLEEEYERNEDVDTARRYAVAQVNLGRIRLAVRDCDGAREAYEGALGLLDVDDEGEEQEDGEDGEFAMDLKRTRVNATLGLALSLFHGGEADEAIAKLEELLASLPSLGLSAAVEEECSTSVLTHLSRLLFSTSSIDTARTRLLEAVSDHPSSLGLITTLAALGLVESDEDLASAAMSELTGEAIVQADADRAVPRLRWFDAMQGGREEDALEVLRREHGVEAKLELVETLLRLGGGGSDGDGDGRRRAEAHETARRCLDELRRDLNPTEARGTEQKSAREYASLAVLSAPWEQRNWRLLESVSAAAAAAA